MPADLQPDVADVLQEEDGGTVTVPVCITEQRAPLRTQALPRKGGATFQKAVTTTPYRLLTRDPRRARATLISTAAANIYMVAYDEASAQDPSTMTPWPGAVPFHVDARTEVWVALPSGGTTFQLGVSTELWAEGE